MTEPVKRGQRTLGIALAIAAVACLAIASFSQQWLVNGNRTGEYGFGLRAFHMCLRGGGACEHRSNAAIVHGLRLTEGPDAASSVFAPLGWVTLVMCLGAALGLLIAGVLAAAGWRPDLPITPTTIALLCIMLGLICGCVFVAVRPGQAGYVGVGLGFWLFGAGCVAGIAASQVLAKVNRPPDPDLMEDAIDPDQF